MTTTNLTRRSLIGIVWLGVGAVVFIVNKVRGRSVPELGDDRPISEDLRDISHPT